MQDVFATCSEARSTVGHSTSTLGSSDLLAQVCLARKTELALAAFWCAIMDENIISG